MLNPKYFLIAPALLGLALAACDNTEDDIFDQSAAVRMDAAKTDTKALLVGATNGWELCYFADNTWEEGHVILMRFFEDETVEMASSNAWVANEFRSYDRYAVQRETSLYTMISDDGPVLTFNTFNRCLHIYSEPYNLPSASYNPEGVPFPVGPQETSAVSGQPTDANEAGYGHNGDYEFVILNRTDDEITLRGKKTRITMRMRRLADNVDWDEYFATVNNLAQTTFSTRFGDLKLMVGDHQVVFSNMTNGVAKFLADDDDPLSEVVTIPFIYTPDGIRLREAYSGYEDRLADVAFQHFNFNPDGTLACVEQPDAQFALNSSYPEIFASSSFSWNINLEDAGGEMKSLFDQMTEEFANSSAYQGLQYLYFNYNATAGRYAITMRVKRTSSLGSIYGSYTFGDNNTMQMTFTGEEGDTNGLTRLSKIASMQQMLQRLSSITWVVSTDSPMAPAHLTFTNSADSNEYFKVDVR